MTWQTWLALFACAGVGIMVLADALLRVHDATRALDRMTRERDAAEEEARTYKALYRAADANVRESAMFAAMAEAKIRLMTEPAPEAAPAPPPDPPAPATITRLTAPHILRQQPRTPLDDPGGDAA